jgi:hypothetical protein
LGRARVLILILLLQLDRLRLLVAQLDAQPAPLRCDAQLAVAEPAHQIEWLPRRLLEREPARVLRHRALDRRPHLRSRSEEAVRRHQAAERLVRPLEVVRMHVEREPARAVIEVGEDRPREKLLPQRLPEALDLAERLRMLRAALHVPDALPPELLLKLRLAAPGRVLSPLVRQNLTRHTERRDAPLESLHHQRRALMVSEHVGHQEARVIVHERREVHALMAAEQEREDVRLPELIGLGPLKASRRPLPRNRRCPLL